MKRPIRDRIEDETEEVPRGPLGKAGGGNIIGAGGYLVTESVRPFFEVVPGVRTPGYTVTSHSITRRDDDELHTIGVTAISEDVARFVAQYVSSPSNIDYITSETKIREIQLVTERPTYSTFRIEVLVDERGELE